jgi:hypothetical protein
VELPTLAPDFMVHVESGSIIWYASIQTVSHCCGDFGGLGSDVLGFDWGLPITEIERVPA